MGSKLVFALWDVRAPLDAALGERLAAAGANAVYANISDAEVAAAMLRLTTFDTPVDAVLAVEIDGDADALIEAVAPVAAHVAGWRVREFRPLEPPEIGVGERGPGLANIAFLRRPPSQPHDEWLACWRERHTRVAIDTQATFGYIQNQVLAAVTPDAPEIAAVVEEHFPLEALADPHAFYGSGGDPDELARRIQAMMRSVATFGADRDIDVVPTSRYRLL